MNTLLTNTMIEEAFAKTGVDRKYIPQYEAEAKRRYELFQKDFPEDEDPLYEDNNVNKSIILTNDYIAFYVEEAKKGHCHKWSDSVARARVGGEHEYNVYYDAYTSIEDEAEKDKELTIHANSLNSDPFFIEQYKRYFIDQSEYPQEDAEKYIRTYLECLSKGKSEVYAKQYALRLVDFREPEEYCDLYASKFEECINKGRDERKAKEIAWAYVDLYEKY